jgi:uncharacterized membrane protein
MPILLGLAAALSYGLSDFLGGLLSRRVHYAIVAVIGNASALVVTVLVLAASGPAAAGPDAMFWGAAAGFGGGFGTLMLYRGLGLGRMGVVAPLSALGTAALPVVVGVLLGDRPSVPAWLGVFLALPAIWLVSTSVDDGSEAAETPARSATLAEGVIDGLLAGVGFALLLVGLNLAGDASGLWPVVASEVTSVAFVSVALLGTVVRLGGGRPPARELAGAVSVGVLGAAAVISYFFATQGGLLSIVAVLTSLYPAATVVLAAVLLHEAISRRQSVGLVLAVASVVLIVIG